MADGYSVFLQIIVKPYHNKTIGILAYSKMRKPKNRTDKNHKLKNRQWRGL